MYCASLQTLQNVSTDSTNQFCIPRQAIFIHLFVSFWQVYKLHFVLWLRNWRLRAIEVERSLRVCWRSLLGGLEPRATTLHFQPTLLLHTWMHAVAVSHDPDAEIQRERKQGKGSCPSLTWIPYSRKHATKQLISYLRLNDNPDFQVSCYTTRSALANIYLAESKARRSIESITPECCGGARWLIKIVQNVCFFGHT